MPFDADAWDEDSAAPTGDLPVIDPTELLDTLIAITPGAKRRAPQERMVHTVHDAVAADQHVAVQAGTGTGKSFGYLVGTIATGKRVIVSTATKQLGEQLTSKDVPAVAAAAKQIGRDIEVALLKGRSNYACRKKVADTLGLTDLESAAGISTGGTISDEGAQVQAILDWVEETETGDRSEAPAVGDRVWGQFSTDSVNCAAKDCPFVDECFANRANRNAAHADVVVTNHTLLAHMMALQKEGAKTVLSGFDVLVADEAHELESAVTGAWSVTVDPARLTRSFDAARRLDPEKKTSKSKTSKASAADGSTAKTSTTDGAAGKVVNAATAKLARLGLMLEALPTSRVLNELPDALVELMDEVSEDLKALERMANRKAKQARENSDEKVAGWVMLANRLSNTATELHKTAHADDHMVVWAEQNTYGARRGEPVTTVLKSAPLTLADSFPEGLGDWTLVLTSATLTAGNSFEPILKQLGIDAEGTDVGSPFDYRSQMMLYVPPPSFPAPAGQDRAEHTAAVQEALVKIVDGAGGRTLGLFTTVQAAKDAAAIIREAFPHLTVLAHGDAPMRQLTEMFRDDETSVLLGTRGLWHGLSIDGPSCTAVVIDKIPFPMANDPLVTARAAKVDAAGRSGFEEVMVATAAISLAQGVGRLIRTDTDRGVVAILDPRLRTKRYGRTLLRSLPAVRAWDDLDTVVAALRRLTGEPVAA